jgi:hypothetical protein
VAREMGTSCRDPPVMIGVIRCVWER